ncbi:cytochrome P450 [Dichomitus squalens LYAD-421 SS1]|uniref:Cytochrome P450 n=1 Tax=Dichomitus squalens (strain LYAD-421) TaxID=732165 RepID=R7SIH5_DICSQ|nr:cytochrome P450 [Dichomitus squalens LYAD-421 SS1]EJF55653.1 cytochrome P450 [Dichomitus squalens LYAD-421 SS1]
MPLQSALVFLFVGPILWILVWRLRRRAHLPLPPGPPTLPIIGSALHVPTDGPAGFRNLSSKYGDVMHLDVFGQPMIVLGSHEAASDLLEKRSSNYSDRPPSPMYGPFWRRGRRAFHQFFNKTAVQNYTADQRREAHRLVVRLIDQPEEFVHHIRHLFGSSIMRIAYGIEVDEEPIDYLQMAEDTMTIFSEAFQPGKYLMETLPALRYLPSWMPGATVKHDGERWRPIAWKLVERPWKLVMAAMREGTARPSMASGLMANVPQSNGQNDLISEEENIYRGATATAYAAGADTTLSSIQSFFLAMASHPEVLHKAQAELDTVVGPHRLPEFDDMKSLPYVCALVKELLRWRVVVPLAVPHRTLEDDYYRGYFIPKGSMVLANIWAIARDPNVYPNPGVFFPERFLKDGELNPDVRDPATFSFGYGRRICPGRHYAASSLFMIAATVLHTLSITAPLGKDGKPVPPSGKMTYGLLSYPEPFECVIKPRSQESEALIRMSCGDVDGLRTKSVL